MTLQNYIADLLVHHNCVVLPDFGGFVGNEIPARYDATKQLFQPPSKNVIFNHHLSNNDGLLADYVGKKKGLDYPSAVNYIENEIKHWINALNEGNRVEIGELGFLFQNGKAIVFEQSRDVNLCLAAYGLKPIIYTPNTLSQKIVATTTIDPPKLVLERKAEPVRKPKEAFDLKEVTPILTLHKEEITVAESSDDKIIQLSTATAPKKRNWIKYVAVAAIIPFAFYSYWIPMETDFLNTGKIQMADFNPLANHSERQYAMRINHEFETSETNWQSWEELTSKLSDNVSIYNYHFSDDLYIPIQLDKTNATANSNVSQSPVSNGKFQLIVGCFGVEENANNLIKELVSKGYSANILDKNKGLFRVSAGGFSDKITAESKLNDLRSNGYSGWILKN